MQRDFATMWSFEAHLTAVVVLAAGVSFLGAHETSHSSLPKLEKRQPELATGTGVTQLVQADKSSGSKSKVTSAMCSRIAKAIKKNETVETKVMGGGDVPFKDLPKSGAVLIGFEVSSYVNRPVIKAIRPVYRMPGGQHNGGVYGVPTALSNRVVAKPGYAVGAITVKAGLGIDGFEITFMKLDNGALDPQDSYKSDWLGGKGGGAETMLGGDGSLVVGVFGNTSGRRLANIELRGLGLITLPQEK
jgi:hypothetical protein